MSHYVFVAGILAHVVGLWLALFNERRPSTFLDVASDYLIYASIVLVAWSWVIA